MCKPSENRPEQLTALVKVPSEEELAVKLVPATAIAQYGEYQAVQAVLSLLIGIFAGSINGIFVNWVTSETFTVTPSSLVLLSLFAVLTIICALFAFYIHRRIKEVYDKIVEHKSSGGRHGE